MKRMDAAMQGLAKYQPDAPCKRGHTSERYTSTGGCIECLRLPGQSSRAFDRARAHASRGVVQYTRAVYRDDVVAMDEVLTALNEAQKQKQLSRLAELQKEVDKVYAPGVAPYHNHGQT